MSHRRPVDAGPSTRSNERDCLHQRGEDGVGSRLADAPSRCRSDHRSVPPLCLAFSKPRQASEQCWFSPPAIVEALIAAA